MYQVSDAYRAAIAAPSRIVRGKVTVGETVITDDGDLRKITVERQAATKDRLVGNLISQKATVELNNKEGIYHLSGGESVLMEIGITLPDDTVEYVPMAPMFVDSAAEDKVKKVITITAYDAVQRAGAKKIKELPEIAYPVTVKTYLLAVCALAGIVYDGADFLGSDRQLESPPNLSGEETAWKVLESIAEAALCNGMINRAGKLTLIPVVRPADEAAYTITADNYMELTSGEPYGPVNRLVLARKPQDDIVYREDAESVAADGLTELVIADNPFLDYGETDHRPDVIGQLYDNIHGLTLWTYTAKWRGDPAIDCGDKLVMYDAQDQPHTTLYSKDTITFTGGLRAQASMETPTKEQAANTKNGITVRDAVKRTEIRVDKVEGEITSIAQQTDGDISNLYSQIQQTAEQILQQVSNTYISEDERGEIVQQAVSTAIQQTADEITMEFNRASEQIDGVAGDLDAYKTLVQEYIRFSGALIELGQSSSRFKAQLTNEMLAFWDGSTRVASISNQRMEITDAEIKKSLTLGKYAFEPRDNGSLSLVWKG